MKVGIERNQWAIYFKEFNRRNRWRMTRLVAGSETHEQEQKNSMPLVGVSLETDRQGSTRIHVMLGAQDAFDARHQTYTITGVTRVTSQCDLAGCDEALEIEDEQGEISLLRFAQLPVGQDSERRHTELF